MSMTAGEIKAEVHRQVDRHMETGGCASRSTWPPCWICATVLNQLFAKTTITHYAEDGDRHAKVACGETVCNLYDEDDTDPPHIDELTDDWDKVTCEKCPPNRETYEGRYDDY